MCATPSGAGAIGIKQREPAARDKAEDAESSDTRSENYQTQRGFQRKSEESRFACTRSEAA
jgi:hypothetical protein